LAFDTRLPQVDSANGAKGPLMALGKKDRSAAQGRHQSVKLTPYIYRIFTFILRKIPTKRPPAIGT